MPLQSTRTRDDAEPDAAEQVRRTLDLLSKGMLRLKLFFFWYMYEHLPVYYIGRNDFEGMTDGVGIYLSERFLEADFYNQLFVLLHELLHIAYSHPATVANKLRNSRTVLEKNITRIVHNIVADAVINAQVMDIFNSKGIKTQFVKEKYVDPEVVNKLLGEDVSKLGFALGVDRLLYLINTGVVEIEAFTQSGRAIDLTTTDLDALRGAGTITVYFTNKKTGAKFAINLQMDLPSRSSSGTCDKGFPSRSGSAGEPTEDVGDEGGSTETSKDDEGGSSTESVRTPTRTDKSVLVKKPLGGSVPKESDVRKIVRSAIDFDKVRRTLDGEKSAGAGASMDSVYELIDTSSRKPRWLDKIRIFVDDYLGSFKLYSWQRIHKRAPQLKPGYYRMGTPNIVILLDTSGSMLDESLNKALSEIFGLIESVPDVKVTLYQWSSECSLPEKVDRYFVQRAKTHKKIPVLTGGTEISPALDKVLPTITKNDLVVIMTDGYIFDIDNEETQKKLAELAKKSARTLFVTVSAVPKLPENIEVIKIED
ncbi:MAG: VWA domain-containing protein [Desulfurococcaceae archaeon]